MRRDEIGMVTLINKRTVVRQNEGGVSIGCDGVRDLVVVSVSKGALLI